MIVKSVCEANGRTLHSSGRQEAQRRIEVSRAESAHLSGSESPKSLGSVPRDEVLPAVADQGRILGRIEMEGGGAVGKACVAIFSRDSQNDSFVMIRKSLTHVVSRRDGTFEFSGLSAGNWTLIVVPNTGLQMGFVGTMRTVQLLDKQELDCGPIYVAQAIDCRGMVYLNASTNIDCNVIGECTEAIEEKFDIAGQVYGSQRGLIFPLESRASVTSTGYYSLSGLSPGNYNVRVELSINGKPLVLSRTIQALVNRDVIAPAEFVDFSLIGCLVSVTPVDGESGAAECGLWNYRITEIGEDSPGYITAGGNSIAFLLDRPSSCQLEIRCPGFQPYSARIDVWPAQIEREVTARLIRRPNGPSLFLKLNAIETNSLPRLSLEIFAYHGNQLSKTPIANNELYFEGEGTEWFAWPDPEGTYAFQNLGCAAGRYRIKCSFRYPEERSSSNDFGLLASSYMDLQFDLELPDNGQVTRVIEPEYGCVLRLVIALGDPLVEGSDSAAVLAEDSITLLLWDLGGDQRSLSLRRNSESSIDPQWRKTTWGLKPDPLSVTFVADSTIPAGTYVAELVGFSSLWPRQAVHAQRGEVSLLMYIR